MGNERTTPTTTTRPSDHASSVHSIDVEPLARIAGLDGAQRVELFRSLPNTAFERVGAWTAHGVPAVGEDSNEEVPAAWFPWSLGNMRSLEWVFVRNAATLPVRPDSNQSIRDIGMSSALHVPLERAGHVVGAACIYWSDPQLDWDPSHYDRIWEWASTTLDAAPISREQRSSNERG